MRASVTGRISALVLLASSSFASADSPALPTPRVSVSQFGDTYFTMLPNEDAYGSGHGTAYRLGRDGSVSELWHVDGWYAFSVFISNDGKYLVRMGNWAVGSEPSEEDLAVAFYENGSELRRYSTADLIEKKESVSRSNSHYIWQTSEHEFPRLEYTNLFYLKTIEGRVLEFDVSTGELLDAKSP